MKLVLIASFLFAVFILGCSEGAISSKQPGKGSAAAQQLTILAASSLSNVVEQFAAEYSKRHNVNVIVEYGGTQMLALQLRQGKKADVLLSANQQIAEELQKEKHVSSVQDFASNRLVAVLARDNRATDWKEALAAKGSKVALGSPGVPVGDYTRRLLTQENLTEAVLANVVTEESNVRQVLLKVSTGDADVGVVYATDMKAPMAEGLRSLEIPISPRANYVACKVSDNAHAATFITEIRGAEGSETLKKWGFDGPQP